MSCMHEGFERMMALNSALDRSMVGPMKVK